MKFIVNAIEASEQGQKLIVDDPNPADPDVSASKSTSVSVFAFFHCFLSKPVIGLVSRDPVTGNFTASTSPCTNDDADRFTMAASSIPSNGMMPSSSAPLICSEPINRC